MTKLERNSEEFPLFLIGWRRVVSLWSLYSYFVIGTQRLQQGNFRFNFFGFLDKVQLFFLLNFFLLGEIFLYLLCVCCVILKKKKLKLFWFLIDFVFIILLCSWLRMVSQIDWLPALMFDTRVLEILIKFNYKGIINLWEGHFDIYLILWSDAINWIIFWNNEL